MSRTKKFVSNAVSSLILQVITVMSGLIIPRLMIKTYGSEINGLVSSVSQFVRYFMLVEAGLASASIYALFKPLSEKNYRAISEIVSATRNFYFRSGYIFVALVAGCSLLYPYFIKAESLSSFQVGILVLIIGCSGVLNFFVMAKYTALITADQKTYVINLLNAVSLVIYTAAIYVMTRMNVDIVTLRAVALVSVFVPPIVMHFYVNKYYHNIDYRTVPNYAPLHKRWDALILQILGMVHISVPVILATIFTSLEQVSVYTVYAMVIIGVQQMIMVFSGGIQAAFGELIALGDLKAFRKIYNQYEFMIYSIMTLFYSTVMVLLLPFVKLYTRGITDVNYIQPTMAVLFVINALLYSIKSPQGTLVTSAGLFKETKYQTLTQALLAVAFGAILAYYMGLNGILIGLIISNVYRDIDLFVFIPKHLNNTRVARTFKRAVLIFVEFSIITVSFVYFKIEVSSYYEWLGKAVFVMLYSMLVIAVISLLFDRKVFFECLSRLAEIVKRTGLWWTAKKKKTAADAEPASRYARNMQ